VGYPEEPPTLNPVTDPSPASRDLLRPLLPSFFRITPDLRYEPSLLDAEPEVVPAGDRTEVRFRIRDDAAWSDGTPVTVQDVAFTWRVMTDPGVDAWNPTGFDRLVDVVADDPKAGRLVLDGRWPGWRDLFAAGRFVLPAHVVAGGGGRVGRGAAGDGRALPARRLDPGPLDRHGRRPRPLGSPIRH
jgi:peptide/nickel transport system substrate-binding protein